MNTVVRGIVCKLYWDNKAIPKIRLKGPFSISQVSLRNKMLKLNGLTLPYERKLKSHQIDASSD